MGTGALTKEEAAAIDAYLDFGPAEAGASVASSFVAATRDARDASGRDLVTGQLIAHAKAGAWLGALGWLCLFDQVGQTLRPAGRKPTGHLGPGQRFKQCLEDFAPHLTKSERDDLWLLRNSLGHSYSLQAADAKGNALFKFVLDNSDTMPLVDRSAQASKIVAVNLREVGELGEQVVSSIRRSAAQQSIRLRVKPQVLKSRYFMTIGIPAGANLSTGYLDLSSPAVTGNYPVPFSPASAGGASASAPS